MSESTYGVCRLSIVPVRAEASDKSEQVTQLLFGDHYQVLETKGSWCRIKVFADGYEGWVDRKQHHEVSADYFDYLSRAEFKITTDLTSTILVNKHPMTILIGSIIPISSSELFKMEEQYAFNGESKNLGQKREFEYLKGIAQKYLSAPYLWGGKTPFGIDCSGFTQMVFRICGYNLHRDAWQQANQGKPLKQWSDTQPGDLAFFANAEGKIVHVGILLGDSRIIHASGKVRLDRIQEEGIVNAETGEQTHRLAHSRRILAEL
jgi:gamma-D-glutamyl-L-lysine dipeptidyl-peptidase